MKYKFQKTYLPLRGTNRLCSQCLEPATRVLSNTWDASYRAPLCNRQSCEDRAIEQHGERRAS